ncbi:cell division protein ZapA [Thioalkalivibrio sp. HK1]|uniref:cell division protein ZapA n=1 Tax=Thioalkalivibrio sp. HK1 TaxID=1469245 RepID=UPI0004720A13|nr:cell division protein ZapA [Thioalkalivibrio sp. HK1]
MSGDESEVVTIRVLGKEYSVICPPGEREGLLSSASLLDERFREMRKSGKIIGTERMAVMAALNAMHQVEKIKSEQAEIVTKAQSEVERMEARLSEAIARFKASNKDEGTEVDADPDRSYRDRSTDPEWFGLASPDPLISDTLAEPEAPSMGSEPSAADASQANKAQDEPADASLSSPDILDPDDFGLDPSRSPDPLFPAPGDDDPPVRPT